MFSRAALACSIVAALSTPVNARAKRHRVRRAPEPTLTVPGAFGVAAFARGIGGAGAMAVAPNGVVYVARRSRRDVVALRDGDGDGVAEGSAVAARNVGVVTAIAITGDRVLVTTAARVLAGTLGRDGAIAGLVVVRAPGAQAVAFEGDAAAVIATAEAPRALMRIASPAAGAAAVPLPGGLTDVAAFAAHPETHELWAWTTRGAGRAAELVRVSTAAASARPTANADAAAPAGFVFYTASHFPADYRSDAFVARPSSRDVARVRFEDFHPVGVEPFLTGFVARATPPRRGRGGRGRAGGRSPGRTGPAGSAGIVGRPVGLAVARDGALLVSDDEAGVIYRVSARP